MKNIFLLFGCIIFLTGVNAQDFTISGYIKNSETGKALENVSVFESHSQIGTISNKLGYFKLTLKNKNLSIQFTETAFRANHVNFTINGDTTMFIRLIPLQNRIKGKKDEMCVQIEKEKVKMNSFWKNF